MMIFEGKTGRGRRDLIVYHHKQATKEDALMTGSLVRIGSESFMRMNAFVPGKFFF